MADFEGIIFIINALRDFNVIRFRPGVGLVVERGSVKRNKSCPGAASAGILRVTFTACSTSASFSAQGGGSLHLIYIKHEIRRVKHNERSLSAKPLPPTLFLEHYSGSAAIHLRV